MRKRPLEELISDEVWYRHFENAYIELGDLKPPTKFYKISICTTSMNRLYDLRQTFIKNIEDNIDYPNLEFVLLNYNSKDEIDDWAKDLPPIVKYYKTTRPKYYNMAHSRNCAFRLASGDVVNSVDADHFTNKGFATQINLIANNHPNTIYVKSRQRNRGRISLFKDDFMRLGGYDEGLKDYGFEDEDLINRGRHLGLKVVRYGGEYCKVVDTHKIHPVANYDNKEWRFTQDRNAILSLYNLHRKKYVANQGYDWGKL